MIAGHVFGPVPSRRLGLSLGIDLVPYKNCTYDCVYCECGPTTVRTLTRQTFFPFDEVRDDLRRVLSSRPQLDSVTLAGSGEPTLSLSLGDTIRCVKNEFPEYVMSVLTNGSLLSRPDVQDELMPADRVIPTLTSAFEVTFQQISRPHPSLTIDTVIRGLVQFRRRYSGMLWLEVFIIPGLNTTYRELNGLKSAIERINPDQVQLNTLDRPPAEEWVRAATGAELEYVKETLEWPDTVIIGHHPSTQGIIRVNTGSAERILATLRRRPSTIEDLVRTTGLSGGEVAKLLRALEQGGHVTSQQGLRGVFYMISGGNHPGDV